MVGCLCLHGTQSPVLTQPWHVADTYTRVAQMKGADAALAETVRGAFKQFDITGSGKVSLAQLREVRGCWLDCWLGVGLLGMVYARQLKARCRRLPQWATC